MMPHEREPDTELRKELAKRDAEVLELKKRIEQLEALNGISNEPK